MKRLDKTTAPSFIWNVISCLEENFYSNFLLKNLLWLELRIVIN